MTPEESYGIKAIEIGIVLGLILAAYMNFDLGMVCIIAAISGTVSFFLSMVIEKHVYIYKKKWFGKNEK